MEDKMRMADYAGDLIATMIVHTKEAESYRGYTNVTKLVLKSLKLMRDNKIMDEDEYNLIGSAIISSWVDDNGLSEEHYDCMADIFEIC